MLDEAVRALVVLSAAVALRDPSKLAAAIDAAAAGADAGQVEEALLQSYLFVGFPAALQAIAMWRERTGRAAPGRPAAEVEAGRAERRGRGEQVCAAVYGSAYVPLRQSIELLQPELADWMIEEGYGKVLGRPGLDLRVRELCVVALLAAQPAPRQLHSHLRGALNVGVAPAEVEETLEAVAALLPIDRSAAAYGVWQQVLARATKERSCS
jgi:4-carboxymuconolactone decarboxylase